MLFLQNGFAISYLLRRNNVQKKIVLCETHPDPVARELIHNNMHFLIQQGFKVFGFEHDEDKSIDFEIESLRSHIETALFQGISYLSLGSNEKLLEVFLLAKQAILLGKLRYQGLDAVLGDRYIPMDQLIAKVKHITNAEREKRMAAHMLAAESGFFIIGADHMAGVQRLLIEKIGEEEARRQFLFIVPFSDFLGKKIDIRNRMWDMAKENADRFNNEFNPVRSLLFFHNTPSYKRPHLTTDDLFREDICKFIGKTYSLPSPSYYSSFIKLLRDCCCPVKPDLEDELIPSERKTL